MVSQRAMRRSEINRFGGSWRLAKQALRWLLQRKLSIWEVVLSPTLPVNESWRRLVPVLVVEPFDLYT